MKSNTFVRVEFLCLGGGAFQKRLIMLSSRRILALPCRSPLREKHKSVLLWEENFDLGRSFRHSFRQAIDFHIKLAKVRAIWDKMLCTLLVMIHC